ncbi:MAG: glutamine synthetase, partial [Desulfobacteraceae bacterium]|nr:glutamine synthetase [Desulfobacteraceae bacterium]
MTTIEHIKDKLKGIDSTKIFFTDLNGRIMGLPVNPEHIESIMEGGIGFDGSSIAGYATIENSDRIL